MAVIQGKKAAINGVTVEQAQKSRIEEVIDELITTPAGHKREQLKKELERLQVYGSH